MIEASSALLRDEPRVVALEPVWIRVGPEPTEEEAKLFERLPVEMIEVVVGGENLLRYLWSRPDGTIQARERHERYCRATRWRHR